MAGAGAGAGFLSVAERRRKNYIVIFFKGPKHRFFIGSHSPWPPAKGGHKALRRDVWEQLLGALCCSFTDITEGHFS